VTTKKISPQNPDIERTSQMDLFMLLDLRAKEQDDYSNTIEIYDAMPKYVWGKKREHKDLQNATITRRCTIRGREMVVKIQPAIIEKPDGSSVLIYPGEREELVEDALRKIAVSGQGAYVGDKAGVTFTLYQLRKELSRMGHTYSFTEILESLHVCRGAILQCQTPNGNSIINSSFFGLLGITTKDEFEEHGRDAKCYVQFNPLVNESIINLTFRQYNYQVSMDIRSALARFLYKRMAQYWSQADEQNPYTPSLVSFLDQSPRGFIGKDMKTELRAMRNALDTLIKHEVVDYYDERKVLAGKQKTIDAQYTIYPHPKFVKEVIKANKRKNVLRARHAKLELENK